MRLDLVQRDFLGLIDEPMEFSERSLADCLREIVDGEDLMYGPRSVLRGLIEALDNPNSEWKLKLSRTKKGPFIPPDVADRMHQRDMFVGAYMEQAKADGEKVEATVAVLRQRLKMSRAAIFDAVTRYKAFCELVAKVNATFEPNSKVQS